MPKSTYSAFDIFSVDETEGESGYISVGMRMGTLEPYGVGHLPSLASFIAVHWNISA
jgi:hypothetical protein